MYIKDYIHATYDVLQRETNTNKTFDALKLYLQSRGLIKLYPSILRGVLEMERRSLKRSIPKVIIARKEDFKKYAQEIEKYVEAMDSGTTHEVVIDENCIGGFIVQSKDKKIDQSYKQKLLYTYQRVTSHE